LLKKLKIAQGKTEVKIKKNSDIKSLQGKVKVVYQVWLPSGDYTRKINALLCAKTNE